MKAFFPKDVPLASETGLQAISSTPFDIFEREVLQIARVFFEDNQYPERRRWKHAFMMAEQRFSPPFGATIAHAVSLMVEALEEPRKRAFSYIPLNDPNANRVLTNEERYFIATLHALRRGQTGAACTHAMLLADGATCDEFFTVCKALAVIPDAPEDAMWTG